jgi:extracellular elastinolytic metalloproteinase
MNTGPDGLPPVMNMGLVSTTNRHTAFDADVVFHEFAHGLTERLVGGPLDNRSLAALESGGMGEGWSDFFALTVQNFVRTDEKVVSGDWVLNRPGGIRRAPYTDNYPFTYATLKDSPEEHDIGEVWCAALLAMVRRLQAALGDKQGAYRLAWQIVVDGLKLTPAKPTFLQGRDAILMALDQLAAVRRINVTTHKAARRAVWEAFARFGMGANASSNDPDELQKIVADFTVPAGL